MSNNENKYSRKVVAEVTGLSLKTVTYRSRRLFPKTSGTGYTAQQALAILNYAPKNINFEESVNKLRAELEAILKGE